MTAKQMLEMTRRYGSIAETIKNMPDVQLRLDDGSIYEQTGRVESISGIVDSSTGRVQCRAAFPNAGGLLLSGSTGNVIIPSIYKDCIVIPQTATYEVQDKIYVYKLVDGKACSWLIEVEKILNGQSTSRQLGLTPGEVIVAEGVRLMRKARPSFPRDRRPQLPPKTVRSRPLREGEAAQTEQAAQAERDGPDRAGRRSKSEPKEE